VTQAREKLHSARETLDPILGRRRPTTEQELDECVQTLEELRHACARLPVQRTGVTDMMIGSLDEVISRIKNRPKGK